MIKQAIVVTLLTGGISSLAFAQSMDSPSCQDFLTMDQEGQMQTVESMLGSIEGAESLPADMVTSSAADGCMTNPDATLGDVVQQMVPAG